VALVVSIHRRLDIAVLLKKQTALWAGAAALLLLVAAGLAQTQQTPVLLPDPPQLLQTASQRYGAGGVAQVQAWLEMLARSRNLSEAAKIQAVNDFWNQAVRAAEDVDIWDQVDYWATPLESLGRRAGDCEDYAIGKYFSLLALGVPAHKLRFVYVKANVGGYQISHMVLGYYATPNALPLVLDNLVSRIEPANQRRDLAPVFSFNAGGIYVEGKEASPVERIGRWNDLLLRMQREGFAPSPH